MMLILLSAISWVLGMFGLFMYLSIHAFKSGRSMSVNSPRQAKFNELALIYRDCLIKCIKVNKV